MRWHFDQILGEKEPRREGWDVDTRLYMSFWYAALYVVIEGWQELKLNDPAIDQLLASPNVPLLKRYRHGTFHFQKEYDDKRFLNFMTKGNDVVAWVRRLHEEFSRFFLEWFGQQEHARR
jgi:hypothetical protein